MKELGFGCARLPLMDEGYLPLYAGRQFDDHPGKAWGGENPESAWGFREL